MTDGHVRLFGIRHHGPGSARSVVAALEEWQPQAVLVELAADCEPLLRWVGHQHLRPPVALLGYAAANPERAVFSPFAEFSPEWCAFAWARRNEAVLRAIDLPLANVLAPAATDDELDLLERAPADPLRSLAEAAGDPDPERWWEDVIEHRGDGAPAFEAVAEAMSAVRGTEGPATMFEARREAHMRQCIRTARSDGFQRIAVVCGAWHVPALSAPFPPAAADAALLRGRPKVKVGVSWVPWTHRRLATHTGYGAGVRSPGWYSHVFANPGDDGVTRWFVNAARLLRDNGTLTSPDHLIAASRAASTLAALRGRPHAGLHEVLDAAGTVLTDSGGMSLIADRLVVGDAIGDVPDEAPQVPLARDLAAQQRSVRLKPTQESKLVELDVRTPNGRARSVLLHRLRALGVHWGSLEDGRGSSGTFRETWRVAWEPELAIRLIERAALGTTVASAAERRLTEQLTDGVALVDIVRVLDVALLADLDRVVQPAVQRLAQQAAHDPDLGQVIDTLGPLARAMRYGDVRGTDGASLRSVFDGLVIRVLSGVVGACRSLDDGAAAVMVERLAAVQAALSLCDHPARNSEWPAMVGAITERPDVHGLVQGRAARLLHDGGWWSHERIERRLSRALSGGVPPDVGAAFVEGFLAGSGTVLVHDKELLGIVDGWLSQLSPAAFMATMPLLRRTFGGFEPGERRQIGRLVADTATPAVSGFGDELDEQRVLAAMATVRQLLGVPS